jgi:micrococcal nuclease
MFRIAILFVLLFSLIAIALATIPPAIADTKFYEGAVVRIIDGDTIKANFGGSKQETVRLGCIDAPENKQFGGIDSTEKLKQLLPIGQIIKLRLANVDLYKRLIGEVYVDNQSINLNMVSDGQAVVYRQYLSICRDTKADYLDAESKAKNKGAGFWSQNKPFLMPWEFRKLSKFKPK